MMNNVFSSTPPPNGAPKRSNSGREIVYLQNQRIMGSGQPVQTHYLPQHNPHQLSSQAIPQDVQEVFSVLREYSYRDLHHWLKLDRRDEIGRFSSAYSPAPDMGNRLSSARSSRTSSVFSMPQSITDNRSSYASSRTSWSMSDAGIPGDHTSAVMSPDLMQMQSHHLDAMSPLNKGNRASTVPASKATQRQRESDLEVKKRYFCTACNKGFARKYDWKVHEQRYHEQQFQYPCPDCNQILYAETHFRSHHRDAHGCQQCTHAKEVTKEVDARNRRTAWGCGFCGVLLDDWEKRCDHISAHYDEGLKRSDWDHSKVILGLLRQPTLDEAWQNFLIERHGHHPSPPLIVKFSKETTARSHGDNLQLQDMLELGAIERDLQAIIELAYENGIRQGPQMTPSASPPRDAKPLDTVTEEQENSSSISPQSDVPQDSVMGSPSMEIATLASQAHQQPQQVHQQQQQASQTYFASSPMDFTSTPQPQDHSMNIDGNNHHSTIPANGFYPFQTPGFTDSIFVTSSFPGDSHRNSSSFDKALPPLPVEDASIHSADVHMMSGNGHFDQWPSMLSSNGFATEHTTMVPTFDPRNQF